MCSTNLRQAKFTIKQASLLQDLSYSITGVPSAKQYLLTILLKALSGNVELITTLNRLGHGISHSALLEVVTAAAMQKILDTELGEVILPDETQLDQETTLVFDNIDRIEETLSGEGTSHRVNGIAVQRGFIGPLQAKKRTPVPKNKRRSIQVEERGIAPYNVGAKPVPPVLKGLVEKYKKFSQKFSLSKSDILWIIARYIHRQSQSVPSWTGFNIVLRTDGLIMKDNIGYLPTINPPATAMSTIYEMLCQSLKIKDQLGLESIVLVCDQAIYAKAVEVAWANDSKFKSIIIRLGAFHTICTFLAVIGKRFADAGLRDIAIESGVIAEGSTKGVFQGKQYNRAVRFHKLMYESLLRIIWRKFVAHLEESGSNCENLQNITDELTKNPTKKTFQEILSNEKFHDVMQSFNAFFEKVKLQGSMSEFWISYITMVKTLLDIIRASREGNFLLHLQAVEAIIPWCFAYDRTNYSRYLPWYIKSMQELESENPKIWDYLCDRGFSVQLSTTNSFGRIPMDQTIEETVNKDTQTTGGTKGFSLNAKAVSRYYITADFRRSCLRQIRQSINSRKEKCDHPDLKTGRIRRDERDIQKIWDLFQTVWKDPFDEDDLSNLATAVEASPEVKVDLLGAYDEGIKLYDTFIEERFINKTKKFDDKIPRKNLKTFDYMNKKTVKVGDKVVEMKVDRNLFAKMAIIAQSRKLPMKEVMSYELGPHPYSLASNDSMPRKTNKATVGTHLEPIAGTSTIAPEDSSACLIDMMSLIQKLPANYKTFAEISKNLFQKVLNEGKSYERIEAVFDVYRCTS